MTFLKRKSFEDYYDYPPRTRKKLISLQETSALFSIPLNTLFKWSSQGKIPRYKIGRRVYINPIEFQSWLENYHLDALS